ncbi:unnamed protein product [Oppiella nova]|uniref:endo-1,4-beta-xylanase n=1 Tax=Oppiella nova TaxID=334625 RepID=A0A7R9M897_9ACAR|nr:unnamed protein product [Oppiella nova]CAG2172336.1 unnamed protein product [Oppiella nova]
MFQFIGKIYAWDVVNEVIHEVSGKLRDGIFSRTFNSSFIEEAFRTAHATDPNAKLYINDYNVEAVNKKSDALYALVKELKGKGVPVHGVSLQAHFSENEIPSTHQDHIKRFFDLGLDVAITELQVRYQLPGSADKIAKQAQDYSHAFRACMNVDSYLRFCDLGVDVAITELNIRYKLPGSADKKAKQAQDYSHAFSACMNVERCVGVTVWGFTDKYSNICDQGYGEQELWTADFQPKSSVDAVNSVEINEWPLNASDQFLVQKQKYQFLDNA